MSGTEAGAWREHRLGDSPALQAHAELGDTMRYLSAALLVAAALLVFAHLRDVRGAESKTVVSVTIAVLVIVVSVATTIQVVRIGDSGARAVWGGGPAAQQ